MFEKFETKYEREKSYVLDDKYYISKTTISGYIFHPSQRKLLLHKFVFATIGELKDIQIIKIHENYELDFDSYLPESRIDNSQFDLSKMIPNKKLLIEVQKYCPDVKQQKAYFYVNVYHKKTKLPSYYGLLYVGDYCNFYDSSINKINLKEIQYWLDDTFNSFIYGELFHPKIKYEYFFILHYFGDIINDYLDSLRLYPKADCTLLFEDFNTYMEDFVQLKDIAIKNYAQIVINEFIAFVIKNKNIAKCPICGELFEYKQIKKYCSEKCRIAKKNRKYYAENAPDIKKKRLKN